MVKEDRSDWVAVPSTKQEEEEDDLPKVTPYTTAYQYYVKRNSAQIKSSLLNSGQLADMGSVTSAISSSWKALEEEERSEYTQLASRDKFRYLQESHLRDVAVTKRKERLRQEREELVYCTTGEGRSTRGRLQQELKREKKRERKAFKSKGGSKGSKSKGSKAHKKKKVMNTKLIDDSGEEEDFQEESEEESEFEHGDDDESSSSSDSDDSDDSDTPKKKKAKKPPRKISQATMVKRQAAKQVKEQKETYIAQRQEHLRDEYAQQAKKRLDFLLKQSDIFRHFGQVKQDEGKFYKRVAASKDSTSTSTATSTTTAAAATTSASASASNPTDDTTDPTTSEKRITNRRDSTHLGDMDPEELEQVDEHEATFLTTQPSTLGFGTMRQYQVEGLNWMIRLQENGVNGILADEMGLGKTLQSISILVYMLEYRKCTGPHLIVVPKSTLSNWMSELERWGPSLTAIRFHGKKEEREEIAKTILAPGQIDEERKWNVCVTTYEICNMEKQVLNKFAWSYLIIDEAHRLKNEASAFSKTIRTFDTRYRLLLTGTPLQNNLHELWALLNFLVPDVFANAEQFDEWFNLDIDDADEKNKLISQLHKILRPFMLRRLKVDVEKSLPPKHEIILFTGMSSMQKKLYKDILMRDIDVLQAAANSGNNAGGNTGSRTTILNIVMQLRKCAGHPYLFPGIEDRSLPSLGEHLVENCGKMVLLDKLLQRLQERGHRVLLFTQMTRLLDILEDYMVMRKFPYCRIDGNTDYEVREESINKFNAPNSDKFLFLLSTRAGGLGLNLQTADVVILYDSDWNPQCDLQAQDRAHRIGQKRPVQVFRLVTEHTIEEKVVERAQQKLKLDAMVVQQGRLKEKDKLNREELLEAVRFGADKVFKSKDSSITDDDIEIILEAGKKKTQELNEKLVAADKGDMLDFKMDGGISAQTFEGVDYSKQDFAQVRAAKAEAEFLGILDMGKRERRTVANYNEDQLYRQQISSNQGTKKVERKEKETKLPRSLRLPRLDEWQMFDREALYAIQEEEERTFRALPENLQQVIRGKVPSLTSPTKTINPNNQDGTNTDPTSGDSNNTNESRNDDTPEDKKEQEALKEPPKLLSDERQEEKDRLLAQGFADWGRSHYTAFLKACAKYGRTVYSKISLEVGKPQSAVEDYATAFWDENIGKKRISESEYDKAIKLIERGEKKLQLIQVLEKGTGTLISLFDNPWEELEFTYVNCKDKLFTAEEDRYLLCWSHKFGYGQWDAVKMAIRRSPVFRFDYYLRSLPTETIGKRCEQLMKEAKKEVEHMEQKAREDAGLISKKSKSNETTEGEGQIDQDNDLPEIKLPSFKMMKEMKRKQAEEEKEAERKSLENKVEEIESQIEEIQNRLKFLQKCSKETNGNSRGQVQGTEFPEDLLPDLVNFVARSGHIGAITITNNFLNEFGMVTSKKILCSKIEDIAKKEKRVDEGDTTAVWHILPEYTNLLTVETIRYLRTEKDERRKKKKGSRKSDKASNVSRKDGAIGPDGDFVEFPQYDGSEEPTKAKKAFTMFCIGTRKEVKASLSKAMRKDKSKVNAILKEKWYALSPEEKTVWEKWEVWEQKRVKREIDIYEKRISKAAGSTNNTPTPSSAVTSPTITSPPKTQKKRKIESARDGSSAKSEFHIPRKKR